MLIDPYSRRITGLRISLTQRCNLNCKYCHHEGEGRTSGEMTAAEVLRIVKVASSLGIRRVKYTGGEPLLRGDLNEIIKGSVAIGLEDVAITTNGTLLRGKASELNAAGLRRMNVSIPSLDPSLYHSLTGGDLVNTISGIAEAAECGIKIKINTVLMRGVNEGEIRRFIELASAINGSLQFIELENLNLEDSFFKDHYLDLSKLESMLERMAERVLLREDMNKRHIYIVGSTPVEVVRPSNNPDFCARCSRIRVTSDGKIKPCLMRSDNLVDILGPMRGGASDEDLRLLFLKAVSLRSPYYRQT
ncbi:MAG: GTP 3',8-cyclase MoaA [Candidatus Methanomethylicota archaeon]|uniref:Probable GTP 3',8-cyclase n=1 Tax=Thermoproteota archaeon TaxID=2056631 RepID=A0A523BEU4_9CREN|nr:MAG: GTP 3',8-cyclase MoaA [Candidatus Verstraetearchaeota archaeon]